MNAVFQAFYRTRIRRSFVASEPAPDVKQNYTSTSLFLVSSVSSATSAVKSSLPQREERGFSYVCSPATTMPERAVDQHRLCSSVLVQVGLPSLSETHDLK